MALPLSGPAPAPPAAEPRPWPGVFQVLWAPARTLGAMLRREAWLPPYLLGMAVSLAMWYLLRKLAAPAGAGGPDLPGAPGMPPGGMKVPPPMMGGPSPIPGAQPLPLPAVLEQLKPMFQVAGTMAAPWFGGLWRAWLLAIAAALSGTGTTFRRAFGVAGYSLVPLWLGQLLAGGLMAWLNRAGDPTRPRWTADVLAPGATGLWQRLLGGLDYFHLWHLLLLAAGAYLLTRRARPAVGLFLLVLAAQLTLAGARPYVVQILTLIGVIR